MIKNKSDCIKVNLAENSYEIIWKDKKSQLKTEINMLVRSYDKILFIIDANVYKLHKSFLSSLSSKHYKIILPSGEKNKNLQTIESLADKTITFGLTRNSCFIAIGGGVTGDVSGFLASIYMRGVHVIQIPTSLLAMVDSSVGGKTGVNLAKGKNMIGSFFQPKRVLICIEFLKTLPKKQYLCGLSEVLKSALIQNRIFFDYLKAQNVETLIRSEKDSKNLSLNSTHIKKIIVEMDEKERNLRATLNFGHTLAHALESFYNYKKILHGEAVSIGIHFASFMSYKKKYISNVEFLEIQHTLKKMKLKMLVTDLPVADKNKKHPSAAQLLALMKKDKKNIGNKILFVLLDRIGHAKLPQSITEKEILNFLQDFIKNETYDN